MASTGTDTTAAGFAQAFYDWYVPKTLEPRSSFWVPLRERPELFSTSLRLALALDTVAQTRAAGEIDGIDWDPYLSSQDPCERYEVGGTSRLDDSTDAVEVFAVCGGARQSSPAVIATMRRSAGTRQFVDFRSPGDSLGLIEHIEILHPATKGAP